MTTPIVLTIPVIHWSHIPGTHATIEADLTEAMNDDGTVWFVCVIPDPDAEPSWIDPLAAWLRENYNTEWVRFDDEGEIIDDLPTYDW